MQECHYIIQSLDYVIQECRYVLQFPGCIIK